ncbi:alpha-L-fucosidase [Schaalia canis]|uniref:alpha-L-fucosidase n=1 Tax=Schaalia canis TaxID=100469 RepID=A0A3P1SE80_9ACTO|nr:alpha-L-fucosidase [Schaalia canis]RRC95336.1 alpha-L-fucosidase [Schaalia canis]
MEFTATTWDDLKRPTPQWFSDTPLGIFIHWGPYSVPAWAEPYAELGEEEDWEKWFTHNAYAEWYFNTIRIEGSEAAQRHFDLYGTLSYEAFLDMWDPVNFDPAAWADLFKRAGADYVVPTTKHHDGVTLWDAPETGDRNTVRRGPRRDLVADIAEATRAAGMRFGVYYSGGLDWHYRRFRPIIHQDDVMDRCRPKDAEYARYCYVHSVDLIDRYAPDVFWNDIEWPDEGKHFNEYGLGRLFEYFYAKCPEGVTNDRYGGVHHDFLTTEYQHMSENEGEETWENCRGIGLSFGYNRAEGPEHYLSSAAALKHLINVVSKGGRLLLDVGPRADGTLPQEQIDCLEGMAAWMVAGKEELVRGHAMDAPEAVCAFTGTSAWVRAIGHEDHGTVFIASESVSDDCKGTFIVSSLPEGFDWSSARIKGAITGSDAEYADGSLTVHGVFDTPLIVVAPKVSGA